MEPDNSTSTVISTHVIPDPSKLVIKKRKIVYPKYEDYKACTCGGEYFQTGLCFPTYPTQNQYKCNKCGNVVVTA